MTRGKVAITRKIETRQRPNGGRYISITPKLLARLIERTSDVVKGSATTMGGRFMGYRNTKVSRWLRNIGACYEARRYFADDRTFDIAWKRLCKGHWVWWIGRRVVRLPLNWEGNRGIDSPRDIVFLKKRIYRRVKRVCTRTSMDKRSPVV